MSSNIIPLNPRKGATLRETYRCALADGYNSTVATGKYSLACAQTMIGFLSAAVIALRLSGDAAWAELFERSAEQLNEDWTCFAEELPSLVASLDAT